MSLKFNKGLLIIFYLSTLIFNSVLSSQNEKEFFLEEKDFPFAIDITNFSSPKKEYINIVFSKDKFEELNPKVIISFEPECKNNRIYLGIQNYKPIHIFLKLEQISSINNVFYICIEKREKMDSRIFNIKVKNDVKAYLPYNMQTNYYNFDSINRKMIFTFPIDYSFDSNSEVTIWAKGRNISKNIETNFESIKYQFNESIIFYGKMPKEDIELTIESFIGESITIGSIIINEEKIADNFLKENANELIIATKGDVCVPYMLQSHLAYIKGKIYKGKVNSDFIDKEKNKIIINNSEQLLKLENDIFIDFKILKEIYHKCQNGYYCLKSVKSDELMIFSIQMIYNEENQFIQPDLTPEAFRKNFLEKDKITRNYSMILKKNDQIKLDNFNEFIQSGQKNKHYITFPDSIDTENNIYIDLLVLSGDVDILIEKDENIIVDKYYLSNKIFYNVTIKNIIEKLELEVFAYSNSFYIIQYQILEDVNFEDKDTLNSGINYIISKNVETSVNKTIILMNKIVEIENPYLATFYSPNCQYEVFLENKEIKQFNNHAQIIIESNDKNYKDKINFIYKIKNSDESKYSNKFCMVYVAGLEISSSKDNFNGRSILLSEGVPHIYTYTNFFPLIYYSYYISDKSNTVVLNFKLIDNAYFNIDIKINNKEYDSFTIYRNNYIYIEKKFLESNCPVLGVCTIDISVEMKNSQHDKTVELTISQIDKIPSYLEKNMVKNDIVNGNNPKYYYFDISNNEYGDITLNFNRGSGNIFAKIETRIKDEKLPDSDWRGEYKFPENNFGSLEYSLNGKKIVISPNNTEKCTNGCYVLITIKSNIAIPNNFGENIPFSISINPRIMKTDENTPNPKVKINLNEFIFGELCFSKSEKRKYDYYTVFLSYDSEQIIIDWQSDNPSLLINVGEEKPTLKESHFNFSHIRKDYIYKIERKEIISKINLPSDSSLRGLVLTIGIYSDINNSKKSSPYAFKIFMPPIVYKDQQITAEIIHIKSDQKVQCLPFFYNNSYICIFAVIFDCFDLKSSLVVYPRSKDDKPFEAFGQFIDAEIIKENKIDEINSFMKKIYLNDNYKFNQNYAFFDKIEKDKSYFFIITLQDPNSIIEVLTSTYYIENNMNFYPNPSTVQIFATKDKKINLIFDTKKDLLLNIGAVNGFGSFHWDDKNTKNKVIYLKGYGDRTSMTTYTNDENNKLSPLHVESLNNLEQSKDGFIFYISYYPKSNIVQLSHDEYKKINFRNVNIPLYFYAPVTFGRSWNVNLNIYDIYKKNNEKIIFEYDILNIWGTILTDEEIEKAKYSEDFKPSFNENKSIKGYFDCIFGIISFKEEDIDKILKIKSEGKDTKPNIFLSVEKSENFTDDITFMEIEININSPEKELGIEFIPEGMYIAGKLTSNKINKKIYKLKLNKARPYFRLEYSANSYFVKFALTSNYSSEKNDNFNIVDLHYYTEKGFSGRKEITIKFDEEFFNKNNSLYFIVFTKENIIDNKLDYFVFKYLTVKQVNEFIIVNTPKENKVYGHLLQNHKVLIQLYHIPYKEVTYYIKNLYTDNFVEEEIINSISMTSSKGMNMIINEPNYNEVWVSSYEYTIVKYLSYIKVMAYFNYYGQKIVYLYTPNNAKKNSHGYTEVSKTQYLRYIEYHHDTYGTTANVPYAYRKQYYKLTIDPEKILDYMIIVAEYYNKRKKRPILYIYSDSKGINERVQLLYEGFSQTEMWLKKEQLISNNLIIAAECLTEIDCGYKIHFNEFEWVSFDEMRVFDYYVDKHNKKMIFKIEKFYLNKLIVYVTGGKNILLEIDDCFKETCEQINFDNGAVIAIPFMIYDFYILRVNADEGDYISIRIKNKNVLEPEIGQISGILRRKLIDKECFELPKKNDGDNLYYLTANLYNSKGFITFTDDKLNPIEDDSYSIKNGLYFNVYSYNEKKRDSLCISFDDLDDVQETIFYSLQIQSNKEFKSNNYLPQHTGFFYPRISPPGILVFFNSFKPKVSSETIVYNMITLEGYPKMFIYDCENFPICVYELNYTNLDGNDKAKKVSEINRISTYFIPSENAFRSHIDEHQQLLVVKCNEININDSKEHYCKFMTSIFGEKENIYLVEKQPFSQYMLKDDTDNYLINISKEKKNSRIYVHIDLLIISGDISVEMTDADSNMEINARRYYLSNKIFYSFKVDNQNNFGLKLVKLKVETKINSFYIIEYEVMTESSDINTKTIYSGINYLVPISLRETDLKIKYIQLESVPIIKPEGYLASFYSLNCKIKLSKTVQKNSESVNLKSFGNFAQDFYTNDILTENIYIVEIDEEEKYLINNSEMCMIYISSFEIYNINSNIRKEILLSEGVPHRVLFEPELNIIRYVYPHEDPTKDITVYINIIEPGEFKIYFFFRNEEFIIEKRLSQSDVIYIGKQSIQEKCKRDELCSITVQIEKIAAYSNYPIMEITFKQITNSPYYIPRGIIRNEYISGNAFLFLYSDIGNNEGYISINFYRRSGYIFAKIVEKEPLSHNEEGIIELEPDWRNYRFIRNKEEESLYYDFYNRKILFTKADTEKCGGNRGCYILITIKSSVFNQDIVNSDFQFFSILINLSPSNFIEKYYKQKKVEIEPEEYIMGSLYQKDDTRNIGVFEYYTIKCPLDIYKVEIDFQSDTGELFINLGRERPDLSKSHLHFQERKDTNIIFTQDEIMKAYNDIEGINYENKNYLELTIGVYSKYFLSLYSSSYAFLVHFPHNELNIYKISSDQKSICIPEKLDNNIYRCLYMVLINSQEISTNLIVYTKSQTPSATINMYANFVTQNIFNSYNTEKLNKLIPNDDNARFNTIKSKTKFIYITNSEPDTNVYISVISNKPEKIELYTSFNTNEELLSPNPSTPQIFLLNKDKPQIGINFFTTKSILINIESIYGEANLILENDSSTIYYLRDADDNLELILPEKDGENYKLIIQSLKYENELNDYPGFVFMINFKLRNGMINIDEIRPDITTEISYKKSDFPVCYFYKILNKANNLNIFFNLYNTIYQDDNSGYDRKISSNDLIIKGIILEEDMIYRIQKDKKKPKLEEMNIIGNYDPVIQAGNIILTEDILKNNTMKKPTFFLAIEKGDQNIKYRRIRGEIGSMIINGDAPVTQNIYQFGKVLNYESINTYKLKVDKYTQYIQIQFSGNSKYVNFAINKNSNSRINMTLSEKNDKKERGIVFITFKKPENSEYIYLNVFLTYDSMNDKLNYYVFKYINTEDLNSTIEYKTDGKIKLTFNKDSNSIKAEVSPIKINNTKKLETSIIYTLKMVPNKTVNNFEENANTISMTMSDSISKQFNIGQTSQNIVLELDDVDMNFKYVQVIARITQGSIVEYVSYNAIDSNNKEIIDPEPVEQYSEEYREIELNKLVNIIKGYGDAIYKIKLNTYFPYDYFSIFIKFEEEVKENPFIIISKDDKKCENNRIYLGTQVKESMYIFIKNKQIENELFYICVKNRNNLIYAEYKYEIEIKNDESAKIPFNKETNYYVSKENIEMKFVFKQPEEDLNIEQINIWAKGKDITYAYINDDNLKNFIYEKIYIFYGNKTKLEYILTIRSNEGDHITVGSTDIINGTTHQLIENSNEILIASKDKKVCIPMKVGKTKSSYINGKVYTKKASSYFKFDNEKVIKSELQISNGIISSLNILPNDKEFKEEFYCLENSLGNNEIMAFSIQMTCNNNAHLVYSPLIPGDISRHILMENEFEIFYGMNTSNDSSIFIFNTKFLKGFPNMYYDICKNFPFCNITENQINNLTLVYPVNRISTYTLSNEDFDVNGLKIEYNSISNFQPLMIVYCDKGVRSELFGEKSFCEFETSFLSDHNKFIIIENNPYSKYLFKNITDKYEIKLINEKADKIYLEMEILSGDAHIEIDDIVLKKDMYYLSNKISCVIDLNLSPTKKNKFIDFEVDSNTNAFYLIQYQFINNTQTEKIRIEPGINYITSKFIELKDEGEKRKKYIDLINFKYEYNHPYLVTFYSPNCKFSAYWIENENNKLYIKNADLVDNFAQQIIDNHNSEKYSFYYEILDDDDLKYQDKFCIVYVTGFELSEPEYQCNNRSISLSEGVPHRFIFSPNYQFITYAYHISDKLKKLVLNFNLIDKGEFNVITYLKDEMLRTDKVYKNTQLYFDLPNIKNNYNYDGIWTIIVQIQMVSLDKERMVELTIYQIDDNPFYLEKNLVQNDILHGNQSKHYFFEIGKEEYGDISLDFKRGSGNIYANIQKRKLYNKNYEENKKFKNIIDENKWRGIYYFPNRAEESLKYHTFGKEIIINENDTEECDMGCYVLITIKSNLNYDSKMDNETASFRISIIPRIIQKNKAIESPKVRISLNEFIIGNIMDEQNENRKYDYYTITLPYDSNFVNFDWQSESSILMINIGEKRPKINESDFEFPFLGQDIVYEIEKKNILYKGNLPRINSLKGLNLTIGIYSNDSDSIYSSQYAFKIFMPPIVSDAYKSASKIIHIRSDQKVQCLPFKNNNKNICLFAVIFDDINNNNNLVVYPKTRDDSLFTIYGKIVDAEKIEKNKPKEITGLIEEIFENEDFKEQNNYIYLRTKKKTQSYFFLTIFEKEEAIMDVLSSTYVYNSNMIFYPNPSTQQIFAIEDHKINFNFLATQEFLLNIVGITGSGQFYWDDERGKTKKYHISRFGERLSLTSTTDELKNKLSNLRVESMTNSYDNKNGGFIFYIKYFPRSNIDKAKRDQNTEFCFRTVKMPLNFYSTINFFTSYTINFNFYDLALEKNANLEYDTNIFNIWGTIVSNMQTLEARANPNKIPQYNSSVSIKGSFDLAFGTLFISSNYVDKLLNSKLTQIPNLFFSVEKYKNISNISSLGVEVSIYSNYYSNGKYAIPEAVYLNGRISNSNNGKLNYLLEYKNKSYLRIEFSSSSNSVKFVLSSNPNSEQNDKFKKIFIKEESGKKLLTCKLDEKISSIYLIIFSNVTNLNKKLDYFVFKYLYAEKEEDFVSYFNQDKSNITLERHNSNYRIMFYPIPRHDVSYYIKAIYKNDFIKDENVNSIAISESKGKYLYINSPHYVENKRLTFDLKVNKEILYIKVLAIINLLNERMFYLYTPYEIKSESETDKSTYKTGVYIAISIACFLSIVVVFLILFIFFYNKKHKNLLGEVNRISFEESDGQKSEDLSMLSDVNELE